MPRYNLQTRTGRAIEYLLWDSTIAPIYRFTNVDDATTMLGKLNTYHDAKVAAIISLCANEATATNIIREIEKFEVANGPTPKS